jgi:hypothetical protein
MSSGKKEDVATVFSTNAIRMKCEICGKEFRTEWELSSHKEVEHIRHLAVAGVL